MGQVNKGDLKSRLLSSTRIVSAAFATLLVIPVGAARAQTDTATIEQVVVTGSRIQIAGYTTPTPVTAVNAEQLLASTPLISESLAELPSMSVGSQRTGGIGTGGSGQAVVNTRNLGQTRTLVLLDGRRFVPTQDNGSVDTSQLPNALVSRVDIVTGGASAAYGSDAVAGVVNYILNEHFEGLKGSMEGGLSSYGDVPEVQGMLAGGTGFANDRGHFLFSIEGYESNGIGNKDRPFAYAGANLITNPCPIGAAVSATCPSGSNGMPLNLRVTNARITSGANGGLVLNGPLAGTTFDVGGAPRQFIYGTLKTTGTSVGGEGQFSNLGPDTTIVGTLARANVFTRTSYRVTDDVTAFAEISWAQSVNKNNSGIPFALGSANGYKIKTDNAYLPASVLAQMNASHVTTIQVGKLFSEFPDRPPTTDDTAIRFLAGVDFSLWDWSSEIYLQHGYNKRAESQPGQFDQLKAADSVDAVVVPSGTAGLVAGQIVCRVTLTNPNSGCVPLDIFGPGAASPAAIAYLSGGNGGKGPTNVLNYAQDVASFSTSGPLLDDWAGTINAAIGGEYRHESLSLTSDPYSQIANPISGGFGGWLAGSQLPYAGGIAVSEGFAELDVPLAKDWEFAKSASLNLAVRETDYSTSGAVTTWKVGALYNPVDWMRLRYTRSRDIRAPTLTQLFQAGGSGTTNVNDPANGNTQASGIKTITQGNPALRPEVANTETMGLALTPDWLLDGLTLSIDRYTLHIAGAIANVPTQTIVNGCYGFGIQQNTSFCPLLIRNGAGLLTAIKSAPLNANALAESGTDFEIDLANETPSLVPYFGGGTFTFRALASNVNHLITLIPGNAPLDTAGETSGVNAPDVPSWRGLTSLTLRQGGLSTLLQMRFVGSGTYDVTKVVGVAGATGINDNHMAGVAYFDARVGYRFKVDDGAWEVYLNVNNILNKTPPFTGTGGSSPGFTNNGLFDVVGRYFRAGVNFQY